MKPMKLKLSLFGMILAASLIASGAQAGYDYIKYREEFKAQQGDKAPASEGRSFEHTSKYQREQVPAQGTELPSPDKSSQPGQKYDRPDWAK